MKLDEKKGELEKLRKNLGLNSVNTKRLRDNIILEEIEKQKIESKNKDSIIDNLYKQIKDRNLLLFI